ncbi:MAG: FAD-binding protein [Eubacterium sp.]|nr:FAD-binding protein [Eubacterium sp.]
MRERKITIIGAGLAGLSAAVKLAEQNIDCRLVSAQISERAQSVLAEGGINAALDVMGEQDTANEHYADTMAGGVYLADPGAVKELTGHAPEVVRRLAELGVPFAMNGDHMIQRNFGGQKKKRTAFCKSSTGKALMTAMIDEVRKYEREPDGQGELAVRNDPDAAGRIRRYPHHVLTDLLIEDGHCRGAVVRDTYTDQTMALEGPVILAFGGPHGLLPGQTTGTTANDGNGLAIAFSHGVEAANLEFLQYHPTTVQISGKRLLISEAARGEGGRLFVKRSGERWYFMEDKYPELGNLMPRDVVSREMAAVLGDPSCKDQVYLDMTGLARETWKKKLPDLREEVRHYLRIDPAEEPVPVNPGIHYFMGGLFVDSRHRTSITGLYAAGECACQYHGANRLGGNSLLGALYGGQAAAQTAVEEMTGQDRQREEKRTVEPPSAWNNGNDVSLKQRENDTATPQITERVMQILMRALGIVRDAGMIEQGLRELESVCSDRTCTETDRKRMLVAEAMLRSALERKESRGAHQRSDFPERNDEMYQKTTVAQWDGMQIRISFREIGKSYEKA